MPRYQLPDYKLQLLGELQRQQRSTLFCDVLLQAEGISVPTHSCILTALSPYLSQKLSASPSPPVGQMRQLQLQDVKAQALLKLVGLLYSGELDVTGSIEQKDVLFAAHQLGLRHIVQRWSDRWREEEVEEEQRSRSRCRESGMSERGERRKRDVHVQTRRDMDTQVEERRCVSVGTQTVEADGQAMGSFIPPGETTPPVPAPAPTVAQSSDNTASSLKPQNITLPEMISPTPSPTRPSISGTSSSFHSGCLLKTWDVNAAPRHSTPLHLQCSADSVIDLNSSSVLSNWGRWREQPQEDSTHQQLSMVGNNMNVLTRERTGVDDGTTGDRLDERRDKMERQTHTKRDEAVAEMRIVSGTIGMNSLTTLKRIQMAETTQISIKVKLRRTDGESWKVVSMEDPDERFSLVNRQSILTTLNQDSSKLLRPQRDQPPPSTPPAHLCQMGKPKTPIPQPVVPTTPTPPPHPDPTSQPHTPSSGLGTSNPDNASQSAPLPQHQGPVEESDEQIQKLLEDIMIDLNLLPSKERDCNSSCHLQPSHNGMAATCHTPAVDGEESHETHVCCHSYGTGSGDGSTDTGIHCSTGAQDQSKCISSPSVQPTTMPIQQHQQPPQCHSSMSYTQQKDGMSGQDMPLSQTQDCLDLETARTSVTPMVDHSSEQEHHYLVCQTSSSEEEQYFPEPHRNESCSLHLEFLDELRLPRCVSPLQPCTSETNYQPVLSNSTNHGDKVQPQPRPQKEQSCYMANPVELQFPMTIMGNEEETCPSLLQDTNYRCQSKQRQKHLEGSADTALMNQHDEASFTGSCTENEVEKRRKISAGTQNVAKRKSNCNKVKASIKPKRKHCESTRDTLEPTGTKSTGRKTKRINALGPLLGFEEAKVSHGTNNQINLSFCSVSLSHNNVLANGREIATSSCNMPSECAGEPDKVSAITEGLREGARSPGARTELKAVTADQTRVITRSCLKKTQEGTSNDISPEIPMAKSLEIMNKAETSKKKRGRPRKKKVEDVTLPMSVIKEVQEKAKPKGKSRKRTRGRSTEVEVIPGNMKQDTLNSGQALALLGISTPRQSHQNSISEELCSQQHKGACSPGDTSAVKPNIDQKQTVGPENADRTKADTVVTPAVKFRAKKQVPKVSLKEFKTLIKRRHLKARKLKEKEDKKRSRETVENVQSEGKSGKKTDGSNEELVKDTEMDVHITPMQNRGGIETSDVILGIAFDENQNKITDENPTSQKDAQNTHVQSKAGPYRHDQTNNEVTTDFEKESEEYSSTGGVKVQDASVNTLSSDGKFPRLEGIEDSQLTGKDNGHKGYMEARANTSAEMPPLGATEEVGPQELDRKVIGEMDAKVDFFTEQMAFVDEDHPVSCFAATRELSKRSEEDDNLDAGKEEVAKMAVDREGEHPLKNPNKAVGIPTSTGVSNTPQSAVTAEGVRRSGRNGDTVPQENKLTTADDLKRQTPQITQPLLDLGNVQSCPSCHEEDEEDIEVDVLYCSPVTDLQTTEWGVGLNIIIETTPEEDDDEEMNDVDVIGD